MRSFSVLIVGGALLSLLADSSVKPNECAFLVADFTKTDNDTLGLNELGGKMIPSNGLDAIIANQSLTLSASKAPKGDDEQLPMFTVFFTNDPNSFDATNFTFASITIASTGDLLISLNDPDRSVKIAKTMIGEDVVRVDIPLSMFGLESASFIETMMISARPGIVVELFDIALRGGCDKILTRSVTVKESDGGSPTKTKPMTNPMENSTTNTKPKTFPVEDFPTSTKPMKKSMNSTIKTKPKIFPIEDFATLPKPMKKSTTRTSPRIFLIEDFATSTKLHQNVHYATHGDDKSMEKLTITTDGVELTSKGDLSYFFTSLPMCMDVDEYDELAMTILGPVAADFNVLMKLAPKGNCIDSRLPDIVVKASRFLNGPMSGVEQQLVIPFDFDTAVKTITNVVVGNFRNEGEDESTATPLTILIKSIALRSNGIPTSSPTEQVAIKGTDDIKGAEPTDGGPIKKDDLALDVKLTESRGATIATGISAVVMAMLAAVVIM